MELLNQVLYNKQGDILYTDFRFDDKKSNLPLLVFCHGFKGFKDWGGFPFMFRELSERGFFCVTFNFSYNGVGNTPDSMKDFTRLDLFAKNTFSRELDDLGSVLDFLSDNRNDFNFDFEKLILAGHSRGGGIAILKTAEDKRIIKLITLASVSQFDRYSERMKQNWKEKGYWEVMNQRTKQMMRLNYTLLQDLELNSNRLNIEKAVSEISIPHLIIHGSEDLAVNVTEAEIIASGSVNSELKILYNTGHTFGVIHPFTGTTNELDTVIGLIDDFGKI